MTLQYYLGHDEHAHPLQSYTGCTGTVQTSLASGHGADANVFGVFEATYTDDGGAGGSHAADRAGDRAAPAQAQAGRVLHRDRPGCPAASAAATRACSARPPATPAGGFQNIGFIEDGDWWSFDPANLTGIDTICGSGRRRPAPAAGSRSAPAQPDGPLRRHGRRCRAPAAGRPTSTCTADADRAEHDQRSAVLRGPQPGRRHRHGCRLQRQLGRLPRPGRHRQRPAGGHRVGEPDDRHRAARRSSSPVRPPTRRATPRSPTPGTSVTAARRTPPTPRTPTPRPGTFTATLTVTDARGAASYANVTVRVEAPNTSCFGARSDNFDGTALDRRPLVDRRPGEPDRTRSAGGNLRAADRGRRPVRRPQRRHQPGAPAGSGRGLAGHHQGDAAATANYQQAGLILYGDDDNYAKLDLLFADSRRVEFIRETAGVPRNEAADSDRRTGRADTVYLRLTSDGTNLTAAYSADGADVHPGRSVGRAGRHRRTRRWACSRSTAAPPPRWSTRRSTGSRSRPTSRPDRSTRRTSSTVRRSGQVPVGRDRPGGPDRPTGSPAARCRSTCPTATSTPAATPGRPTSSCRTRPAGDWTIETKVDGSQLNEQYQQAGLIVYGDDDNYLKLDYIVDNAAGQPVIRRIEFRSEIGGVVQNPQPQVANLTRAVWHLRLAKAGNVYTGVVLGGRDRPGRRSSR